MLPFILALLAVLGHIIANGSTPYQYQKGRARWPVPVLPAPLFECGCSVPHQDRDGGVVKDMARGATKNELSEARAAEATHDEEVGAVSRDLCEQFDTGIAARAGLDPLNVGFDAVAGERRADLCTRDIV